MNNKVRFMDLLVVAAIAVPAVALAGRDWVGGYLDEDTGLELTSITGNWTQNSEADTGVMRFMSGGKTVTFNEKVPGSYYCWVGSTSRTFTDTDGNPLWCVWQSLNDSADYGINANCKLAVSDAADQQGNLWIKSGSYTFSNFDWGLGLGPANIKQTGGSLSCTGTMILAGKPEANYTIEAGSISVGDDIKIGEETSSIGKFTVSGANSTVTIADELWVGNGGDGIFNMSGGTLSCTDFVTARTDSSSSQPSKATITGGSITASRTLWHPFGKGRKAELTISGGDINIAGEALIARGEATYGTFTMSGGSMDVTSEFKVCVGNNATGVVHMAGCVITNHNYLVVGCYDVKGYDAYMEIDGGAKFVSLSDNPTVIASRGGNNSKAVLCVKNGELYVKSYVRLGEIAGVDSKADATLILNDERALVDVSRGKVYISSDGSYETSVMTLDLKGGTLITKGLEYKTGNGPGYINLAGGTLKAAPSADSSFVPANNKLTAYVKTGGAIIDSNGNDITFGEPLLTGETNDGGLVKKGTGTLTLASGNTYTGATVVEAGTIAISDASPTSAGIVLKGGSVTAPANFTVPFVELASGGEVALPSWYTTSMKLIISGDTTLVVPQGTALGDVEFRDNGKIVYEVDDYTAGNEVAIGLIGDISLPTASTLGSCMKARVDGYVYECSTLNGSVSVPASLTVWKNDVQTGDFNSVDNWSNGVPTALKLGIFNSSADVSSESSIRGSVKISNAANVTFKTQASLDDVQVESGGKVTISGNNSEITHALTGSGAVDIKAATAISGNISGALVINWTEGESVHLSGDNNGFTGSFTANSFQKRMYFDSADSGSASAVWNIFGDAQVTPANGTIKFGALNYTKNDFCVFYFDDNSSVVVEVGEKGSDCELSVAGDCWLGKIGSYTEVPGNVRIVKKGAGKMRFGMGNVNHLEVAGGELSLVGNKFPLREIVLSGGVVSTESAVNEMLSYDYVSGTKHFSNLFEVTSNGGTLALPYDAKISAPVQCVGKLVKTGNGTLTIASGFAGEIEVKGGKVVLPCGTEITSVASANVVEVKRGYVTVSAGREFSSVKLEDNGALAIDMSEMCVGFNAVNQTVDLLTTSSYTMSDDEEIDGCVFAVGTPYLSHIAFEDNKLSATSVYLNEGNMWICQYTNGYGDGMWSTSENWMNGFYPNKRAYTIFSSEYINSDFGKDKTENCAFGRIVLRKGTELAAKAKSKDPTLSAIEICGNGCLSCAHIGLATYGDVGMTISEGVTFRTRIYSGDSDSWISSSGGQLITVNGPYICEDGRLVVYNKTIFNGPFTYKSVNGTAQISVNTEMNGNLTVTGNISFNNSTKINRTVTLKSGASFTMNGTFGNDAKLELDGCDLANCTLASGLMIPSLVVKEGAILSGITDQTVTNVKFEDGSYFVVALGDGNKPAMLTASSFEFGKDVYGILSATDAANAENGQIYAGTTMTGAPMATVLSGIGGTIAGSSTTDYYWTTTHGDNGVWLNAAQVAETTVNALETDEATVETQVSIRDADLAAWLTANSATESVNTANANGVTGIMAYMLGSGNYTGAQKPVLDAAVADGKATLTFDESAFRSVLGLKLKYYLESCDNVDFSGEVEKSAASDDPAVELDIATAKLYNRLCAEVYAAE